MRLHNVFEFCSSDHARQYEQGRVGQIRFENGHQTCQRKTKGSFTGCLNSRHLILFFS